MVLRWAPAGLSEVKEATCKNRNTKKFREELRCGLQTKLEKHFFLEGNSQE